MFFDMGNCGHLVHSEKAGASSKMAQYGSGQSAQYERCPLCGLHSKRFALHGSRHAFGKTSADTEVSSVTKASAVVKAMADMEKTMAFFWGPDEEDAAKLG
jgi:hypothetical protein